MNACKYVPEQACTETDCQICSYLHELQNRPLRARGMTRDTMRKALDLIDERHKYKAAIEYNKRTTSYIKTESIFTGIGTTTISIDIPWTTVEDFMEDRIQDIENWLDLRGIDYDVDT
jgi:hypothetical protein